MFIRSIIIFVCLSNKTATSADYKVDWLGMFVDRSQPVFSCIMWT